jgi:transposase
MVLRARIVLLAAGGAGNSEIARRLGTCEDTARKWRRRYCEKGLEGLSDAPRPGRPRVFPAAVVAGVKALACEMPAASGTPLARWTCPELARKAAADGTAPAPSPPAVRRWLADDALKP